MTVDLHGTSGGLTLFYNFDFQVNVLFTSNRVIDVEAAVMGKKIFLTFVYGDLIPKQRDLVWERLTMYGLQ